MPTSFIIFAPEQERKRLRDNGVLPPGFFGDIDHHIEDGAPFCFWPYELNYAAGDELAASVREHPVHVPEFFGMKASADVEARNLATDRVVKVLKSVSVHIVFLDDDINNGREDYVSFRSFAELTRWSANLNEVLRVAFARNHMLSAPESVLVLIARSASIKVSREELAAFSSQIGEGRTFTSCYFLDHHLAIGGGRDFAPSRDVWDLMVARLLHAFYLSCDGRSERVIGEFWTIPGIKVWRASECVFSVDDKTSETTRRWIRSWVYDNLCNRLADGDAPKGVLGAMESPEMPGDDQDGGNDTLGFSENDYWLRVDPAQYKRRLEDPRRVGNALRVMARYLAQEHDRLRTNSGDGAAPEIFGNVHQDAGYVQPSRKAIDSEIRLRLDELQECDPETEWKRVTSLNGRRQKMMDDLNSGDEFSVIKRHYIGWKLGFAVLVSVVSGYGVFAYLLLSKVLGAGVFYSILAGLSISIGAFAMLTKILIAHNRAGQRAVRAMSGYCREIDRITKERDGYIRSSVYKGMRRHMLFNQLACGSRVKSLLERLFTMLETELQGSDTVAGARDPSVSVSESELRVRFKKSSRHDVTFVPGKSVFEKSKIDKIVEDMWNGRSLGHDFSRLWKDLCKNDSRTAGHFPAAAFIPALRRYSSEIVDSVYAEAIDRSIDPDSQVTVDAFTAWMGGIAAQNYYAGFSSEINASVVDTNRRCQHLFFFPRLRDTVVRVTDSAPINFSPHPAPQILAENGTMAMAYEEAVVEMAIDANGGLLGLVEARGANHG